MLLKDKHTEPPNGWEFVEAVSGTKIHGDFRQELVTRVIEHRVWLNHYRFLNPPLETDPALVTLEVERQICLGLEEHCNPEPGETVVPVKDKFRELTSEKIMAFSHTVFAFLKDGAAMCSGEESQRRAAICRGCKFNRLSGTCVCTLVWKMLDALVPRDRREGGLKVCGICGCTLAAKVILPAAAIAASNQGLSLNFPSWCWQKQTHG